MKAPFANMALFPTTVDGEKNDENACTLEQFENLVRKRRATRHFLPKPVSRQVIERLLRISQWAPSGFNMQPTRFVVVQTESVRKALRVACMDQPQLEEASTVVVFIGDRNAFEDNYMGIIKQDLTDGAISEEYAQVLRKNSPLMFGHGPYGLGWLWKALLVPIARLFRPIPEIVAVHKRFWLAKQVMLNVMNFMLAAEAAGLNTIPIEGFDTGRVKKALGLACSLEPILVVPIGYAVPNEARKTRRPLAEVTAWR